MSVEVLLSGASIPGNTSPELEVKLARILGYDGIQFVPKRGGHYGKGRCGGAYSALASFRTELGLGDARGFGMYYLAFLRYAYDPKQYRLIKTVAGEDVPVVVAFDQINAAKTNGIKNIGVQIAPDVTDHFPNFLPIEIAAWYLRESVLGVYDTHLTPRTGLSPTTIVKQGIPVEEVHIGYRRDLGGGHYPTRQEIAEVLKGFSNKLKRVVVEAMPWSVFGKANLIKSILAREIS